MQEVARAVPTPGLRCYGLGPIEGRIGLSLFRLGRAGGEGVNSGRVTAYDVAGLAGVSQSTVSRVLNGKTSVRPDIRVRVEEAARKLGYIANATASNLRRNTTRTIALVVLYDDQEGIGSLNPFYTTLQGHISVAANAEGYAVLTSWMSEKMGDVGLVMRGLADGYIVIGSGRDKVCWDRFRALADDGVPVVGWGIASQRLSAISAANVEAAAGAVEHLVDVGCRAIACLSPRPGDQRQFADRVEGYRSVMTRRGMEETVRYCDVPTDRLEQGVNLMREVLDEGRQLDGIFATCDLMAIGALRALHERGVSVPGQLALCGFDGIYATRLTNPSITTVEQDMPAIARRLVSNFIGVSSGEAIDTSPVPGKLVIRDSTRR
ncbi:LacI family transcriptional regulator [Novosphingobium pentaromativorans US6-1]|uniref:LacI family transcription regulator n=1 Tax=Novosphingobium pentaromativorans US6-1 TaxID=1088721 RepID=G6EEK6_9SPHN|nr:LacI family transcriptional regulator [Novosphingobium pentaromativorans US6-1]EHJ60251.1 LacI family transcription regulator [Novosphingobium pentaromativorans US6-1]